MTVFFSQKEIPDDFLTLGQIIHELLPVVPSLGTGRFFPIDNDASFQVGRVAAL